MTVSVPKSTKQAVRLFLKFLTEPSIADYYSSSLTLFLLSVATLRVSSGQ
jgi:hypothetical protein